MAKKKRNKNKKLKLAKTPRNPFALDPIMRKGGSHEKTNKAKRKKDKSALKKELKRSSFFCGPNF